jgi:arylsulfatase
MYRTLLGLAAFPGLAALAAAAEPAPSRRPNILLILTDDLGWSALDCYGGEIRIPDLDRLARSGLRFTPFYNCACCCPSRTGPDRRPGSGRQEASASRRARS